MTVEFALSYIPRRMKELGYGDEYLVLFRHLRIRPNETREIEATSQIYLLVDDPESIIINSDFGVYDISDETLDEITYEHQGLIQIINTSTDLAAAKFIQVIPKTKQHGKHPQKI